MENSNRFNAYVHELKAIYPVIYIDYEAEKLEVRTKPDCRREYRFSEVDLLKCTGLKDSHGILIYEKNLFRSWNDAIYEVNWNKLKAQFQVEVIKHKEYEPGIRFMMYGDVDGVVINVEAINENKELLGGPADENR